MRYGATRASGSSASKEEGARQSGASAEEVAAPDTSAWACSKCTFAKGYTSDAELGAGWEAKFAEFEHKPAAAASLGQVHRARSLDGAELACKLQYPDMQSAVEADLRQLALGQRGLERVGGGSHRQRGPLTRIRPGLWVRICGVMRA